MIREGLTSYYDEAVSNLFTRFGNAHTLKSSMTNYTCKSKLARLCLLGPEREMCDTKGLI